MIISSPAFKNGEKIPDKYTCRGENVSPPLSVSGVPEGTVSLVLVVEDPDALNGNWVHWVVWNINPSTEYIPEDSVPKDGFKGINDFGHQEYGGPCPPSGVHRYFFKLYALSTELDLRGIVTKGVLESKMEGYILARAELIGLYGKE